MAFLSSALLALAENDLAANRSVDVEEEEEDDGKSWRRPDLLTALAFLMVASRIMVIVSYSLSLDLLDDAFRYLLLPTAAAHQHQHQQPTATNTNDELRLSLLALF